jgi:hypothetical protein
VSLGRSGPRATIGHPAKLRAYWLASCQFRLRWNDAGVKIRYCTSLSMPLTSAAKGQDSAPGTGSLPKDRGVNAARVDSLGRGAEVASSQSRTVAKRESCGGEASGRATRPYERLEQSEAAARLATGSRLKFLLDDAPTVVVACLHCQAVLVAGDRCAAHETQSVAARP